MELTLPWPPAACSPNAGLATDPVCQIDLDLLRSAIGYDPETGRMWRMRKTGQNVRVGAKAGWVDKEGYVRVRVMGSTWSAHRLAWVLHHGTKPLCLIDHINGDRADNRIANLRLADASLNLQNIRSARRDSRLGVIGVRERRGRFDARIMLQGKSIFLGAFGTAEEAGAAYLEAKRMIHEGCTI